jgi:hypothetical protein
MMVESDCDSFLRKFSKIAKDLDNLKRCQLCLEDFNFSFVNQKSVKPKNETINSLSLTNLVERNESGLILEAIEDEDYDIDEIRFWNFISKNKNAKPNIIRTLVYKHPDSSYIYKKKYTTTHLASENNQCKNKLLSSQIKYETSCDNILEKGTQTNSTNWSLPSKIYISDNKNSICLDKTDFEIDDDRRNQVHKNAFQGSKNKTRILKKRTKVKVVTEKAKEPVSTISIENKATCQLTQQYSKPRELMNNLAYRGPYRTSPSSSTSSVSNDLNPKENIALRQTRSNSKLD